MTKTALTIAAVLLTGTAAWAAEGTGPRMQGSPNAAGYTGKGETTGTAGSDAAGQPTQRKDGRMQGPPNASGFNGDGAAKGAGNTSGGR